MTPDHRELLPISAARAADGALTLGGCSLAELAERYGTPLYIYDAATLDRAAASYQAALANAYPAAWEVAYAAKAWLNTATARWAAARGLGLDVVSAGELAIALHGGFPAERIHFHGNNKQPAELAAALAAGVGRIVVDHAGELALLNELALAQGARQPIWLRVNPDVDADTHGHTRTGHAASKFGLALADGTAEAVARQALAMPGVALLGLHCHVGSQLRAGRAAGAGRAAAAGPGRAAAHGDWLAAGRAESRRRLGRTLRAATGAGAARHRRLCGPGGRSGRRGLPAP